MSITKSPTFGSGYNFNIFVSSNGSSECVAYTEPFEIIVNPAPTVTLIAGPASPSTFCVGQSLDEIMTPNEYPTFEINGATSIVIRNLDKQYTPVPVLT